MHVCIYVCVCCVVYMHVYIGVCVSAQACGGQKTILQYIPKTGFLTELGTTTLAVPPPVSTPHNTGVVQLYVWVLGFKLKSSSLYSKCLSTGPPLLALIHTLSPSLSLRQCLMYPRLLSNSLYS